jgi:hypothetical protein
VPTRSRRTMIVSPSLLVVGVAVVVLASCSSPDAKTSAIAGNTAGSTFSPNGTTTSTPSVSPPPSAVATSSQVPVSKLPSQVPASKPKRVDVVTTFAGWNATSGAVEVGGYATVVEPVGTCTLRLTRGDQVVTVKHTASADATTVACGGFSVPRKELTAGQWQAVLAYASPRSAGAAATVTVKVP